MRREEAAGAGGGEPVEIVARGFGRGFRDDGDVARDQAVKVGPVPARRAFADGAVGEHHFEGGRGGLVHGELDFWQAPEQNENREDRERHPGFQHDAGGVFCRRDVAVVFFRGPLAAHIVGDVRCGSGGNRGAFGLVVIEAPDFFRLPDEEKTDRREDGDDGAGDVDEIAVDVIRPEELRDGK